MHQFEVFTIVERVNAPGTRNHWVVVDDLGGGERGAYLLLDVAVRFASLLIYEAQVAREGATPQQVNEWDAALEWESDHRNEPDVDSPAYEECDACGKPSRILTPESDHPNAPWKCEGCSTAAPGQEYQEPEEDLFV